MCAVAGGPFAIAPTPFHDDRMFDHLTQVMDKLWAHCNVKRMGGVAA